MFLTQTMDNLTTAKLGEAIEESGPASLTLYRHFNDTEITRSYIATCYWQAFTSTATFMEELRKRSFDPRYLEGSRQIIVARARMRRFDLLVFYPSWPNMPFTIENVSLTDRELMDGWLRFVRRLVDPGPLIAIGGMAAVEAAFGSRPQAFSVVVSGGAAPVPTAAPSPSWKITEPMGSVDSTAGVAVLDKTRRSGVTAALHAIGAASSVTVNGSPGTVVATSALTDSCFIETTQTPGNFPGNRGPLVNILPRGNQSATFDGVTSGLQKTNIDGWDRGLPYITTFNQLHNYTPPITNTGDSGAALVTDDDFVSGFAFERSPPVGAVVEFSSWVWAHAVYERLSLEYGGP
jgi:hypothetical protein